MREGKIPDGKRFLARFIEQPIAVAILILSVVILLVWIDQRDTRQSESISSSAERQISSQSNQSTPVSPTFSTGLATQSAGEGPAGSSQQAPGLGGLLAGLEAKVEADPGNIGNQKLLVQTYKELGMRDKALAKIRGLIKNHPDNESLNQILESILGKGEPNQGKKDK
jgi:hypothetical protein